MSEKQTVACDLTAIPEEARQRHLATVPEIFAAAQEVQELPNGFAFRYANEPGRFMSLAKFVEYEQLCCPFEGFAVEIEPHGGPIWLRLTGDEEVKEALAYSFRNLRQTADNARRDPDDEEALEKAMEQLSPTMSALMEQVTPEQQA